MAKKIYTPLPLDDSEASLEARQSHLGRHGPRGGMAVWVDGQRAVKIPISRGLFALIDHDDYPTVGQSRWSCMPGDKTYYAYRLSWSSEEKRYIHISMHRLVMGFPDGEIDHRFGKGWDNRKSQLRVVSHSVNIQNSSHSKKEWKGVTELQTGKFRAQIGIDYKMRYLGEFDSGQEAALVYDLAALEIYGPGARLNFATI